MKKRLTLEIVVLLLFYSSMLQAQTWTKMGGNNQGENRFDRFGTRAAISNSGDRFAASAAFSGAGYVKVHRWVSPNWFRVGNIIVGEQVGDAFGSGLAMNNAGDRVAIGARFNSGNGASSGHVRVMEHEPSTNMWNQLGNDIDGQAAQDFFGFSVDLNADGNQVVVGATGSKANGTGSNTGNVRVFQLVNGVWVQSGNDINGDNPGDEFGTAVASSASGTRIAVGSPKNDLGGIDAGLVRVFEFQNGDWVQLGADILGEAASDLSGEAISINASGDRVLIGAPQNDGRGDLSGHVRIYELNNGVWVQLGADIDGEASRDFSGRSVSMDDAGDKVLIGAPGNDGRGQRAGHGRIYEWNGTQWAQLGADIDSENSEASTGTSSAISGSGYRAVLTAPSADGIRNLTDIGRASLYEIPAPCFVTIPDVAFKAALLANMNINTNGDQEISCDEANNFSGLLNLSNLDIADLTGIEAFFSLTELDVSYNNRLTNLPLSQNDELTRLLFNYCDGISSVDFGTINKLFEIRAFTNASMPLATFDVSLHPSLVVLEIVNAQLTTLDLTQNPILKDCNLNGNQIASIDLSANTLLEILEINSNLLINLDLSNNTLLEKLSASDNKMSTLNLLVNVALEEVNVSQNRLVKLGITTNEQLTKLDCTNNRISEINFNQNRELLTLNASSNRLQTLYLANNSKLGQVRVDNNQLTTFDFRNGNNINIDGASFDASNNVDLLCISVDDIAYATTNWTSIDAQSSFNIDCTVSVDDITESNISVYPNPTTDWLDIVISEGQSIQGATLYDLSGHQLIRSTEHRLSLHTLPRGMYILEVILDNGGVAYKKLEKL